MMRVFSFYSGRFTGNASPPPPPPPATVIYIEPFAFWFSIWSGQ